MAPIRANSRSATNFHSKKLLPKTIAKAAKPVKAMKAIFRTKVMSFSGDFGDDWTHEKMAGWIKLHGGEYVREVTEETTHLICTIEDFKNKTTQVRKAWKLGSRCHIVVKDWLEDCLHHDPRKKRCRAEKGYTINRILNRIPQTFKAQERYRASFEAGVRAGHELVDNRLHHIFCDQTGFEYKAVCTRINTAGKVKFEKYTIYLFESHAIPHHYMAGAKLSQPGRHPSFWRLECHPKPFPEAFQDFKMFFKKQTGMEWDDRLDGEPQIPDPFKYDVPKLGRPVGFLPQGKEVPEEQGKNEETDESSDSSVGLVHDTDSEVEDMYDNEHTPKPLPRGQRSLSNDTVSSGFQAV